MADDIDRDAAPASPPPPRRRKRWGLRILAVILLVPAAVLGLWLLFTLNYSYSTGDRAGYLQKFSRKGWVCKTWEGEIAMVNIPGTAPEIFRFSVRDAEIAAQLDRAIGRRVALVYKQHRGIPTSCFGDTEYYVSAIRLIDEAPPPSPGAPVAQPTAPAAPPVTGGTGAPAPRP